MSKLLSAAVVTVLACTVSACGSGDDETASKNISASILKTQKSSTGAAQLLRLEKKDADCIGDGLVEEIGTDRLQEYGVLAEDMRTEKSATEVEMSVADATAATDVLFACSDVATMMRRAVARTGSIPQQMQACVDKALNEDNLRPMFSKVFQGKQAEAQRALTAPVTKCATGSAG
jgi:hypothetical protein